MNKIYCDMILLETPQLDMRWLCSNCEETFKMTKQFEKNITCPECGATIEQWISIYDDEDE